MAPTHYNVHHLAIGSCCAANSPAQISDPHGSRQKVFPNLMAEGSAHTTYASLLLFPEPSPHTPQAALELTQSRAQRQHVPSPVPPLSREKVSGACPCSCWGRLWAGEWPGQFSHVGSPGQPRAPWK
jgi:hypothetical protein